MSWILRTFDCADCGAPTTRRRHPGDLLVCRDCGIERAAQAAREMANRSGPAWDAWVASNARGATTHR